MTAAIVSLVPVIAVVLLTVLAFLFTRRPRPVTSMIPAFTGAILAGTTLGTAFCTLGLLNVIRGIRVTGSGGIAVVSGGIETANEVVRICLYASAVAALFLLPRFFLAVRRIDSTEAGTGRRGLIVSLSLLPLLFAVAGFTMFYRLNDEVFWRGSEIAQALGSAQAFAAHVTSRTVAIAAVGLAGFAWCLVGIFSPFFFRAAGGHDGERRFGTLFLPLTAGFVVVALVLVERFFAMARSLAYGG